MFDALPAFTADEERLALELYHQLTDGQPVQLERLASALGIGTRDVTALLEAERLRGLVYYDEAGRVIGFRGLAVVPMHHRLEINGRTLYTWCAADSLFIPALLGQRARVASPCPQSGAVVRLTVTRDGVEAVEPAGAVVSFLRGDPELLRTSAAKVMASFCHHIFFLASPAAGAAWMAWHKDTFLLTIAEAFEWGKRLNAVQFKTLFGEQAA